MKEDYLTIYDCERYVTRIAWFIVEHDEYGAILGDDDPKGTTREDLEIRAAFEAVKPLANGRDRDGFFWESLTGAKKALTVARAAIKAHRANRPLEDWEKKDERIDRRDVPRLRVREFYRHGRLQDVRLRQRARGQGVRAHALA